VAELGDLAAVILIAVIAAGLGLAFGIVFLAPRLTRLLDRNEEPGDEPE
jgi:hypothetical protein